jgi:hypothetical protein
MQKSTENTLMKFEIWVNGSLEIMKIFSSYVEKFGCYGNKCMANITIFKSTENIYSSIPTTYVKTA